MNIIVYLSVKQNYTIIVSCYISMKSKITAVRDFSTPLVYRSNCNLMVHDYGSVSTNIKILRRVFHFVLNSECYIYGPS